MYNLRYHIITIVAIFLALALGLLMGAAIGGSEALRQTSSSLVENLRKDYSAAISERDKLKEELLRNDRLGSELFLAWSKDRLAKKSILVLTDSSSTASLERVEDTLSRAGAQTIRLNFNVENFDSLNEADLSELKALLGRLSHKSTADLSPKQVLSLSSELLVGELESGALARIKSGLSLEDNKEKQQAEEQQEGTQQESAQQEATQQQEAEQVQTDTSQFEQHGEVAEAGQQLSGELLEYLLKHRLINLTASKDASAKISGVVCLALSADKSSHPWGLALSAAASQAKIPTVLTQLSSYDDKLLIDAQTRGFSGVAACETMVGEYGLLALLSGAEAGVYGIEGAKTYPDLPQQP